MKETKKKKPDMAGPGAEAGDRKKALETAIAPIE